MARDRAGFGVRARLAATCSCGVLALAMTLAVSDARAADATATADATAGATSGNPDQAGPDYGPRVSELVVEAQPGGAVQAQPVQAPLQEIEPTAIVTRDAIDQFVPQTGDYSEVVLLTPSAAGISFNGPGLYEAKTTLRGFQDGQYNVTYDGIPFGDTNDFTHHTTSFFPAANIGAVSVERGPGGAGQLGEATFGGSINIFSPEVGDEFGGSEQGTYGSWNTVQSITKINTGDLSFLHGAHALVALTELGTDGYLTHSGAYGFNQMGRLVIPVKDSWNLTLFGSLNYTHVYQDDNNGASRQQVALFGKNFALTNNPYFPGNSPSTEIWPGTFLDYNTVSKHTDFEYAKLTGDFTSTTHLDNALYSYYYDNQTLSAQDVVTGAPSLGTHTDPNNPKTLNNPLDVPGYTKFNHYRVYGDILHLDQELPFGVIKAGVWLEHSDTHRSRYDWDLSQGLDLTPDFHDPTKTQVPPMTAPANILYDQHSNFSQYQPFVDFVWNATPQLTITPGLKYFSFSREATGPFNQGARNGITVSDHASKLLYFLTANYKIQPNWSVYGQYATGFLQAPLSVLQNVGVNTGALKPQETVNYQIGTVYQSRKFTFDADYYYIQFNNLLQSTTGTLPNGQVCPTNETCFFNIQGAVYQGAEGQATVGLTDQLFGFVNGSWNSAKNDLTGLQIAKAPAYTLAAGAIWTTDSWRVSLVDKLVGDVHAVDATCTNAAGPTCGGVNNLAAYNFYHFGAYNQADLTVAYKVGHWRLEAAVYNLFNSQAVTQITPNSKKATSLANPTTLLDQLYFQPPINFQLSVRLGF